MTTLSAALLIVGLLATAWFDTRESRGARPGATVAHTSQFPGDARTDSALVRRTVEDSTVAFLRLWRELWQQGMQSAHGQRYVLPDLRRRHGHCHVPAAELDGRATPAQPRTAEPRGSPATRTAATGVNAPAYEMESSYPIIRSSETVDAVCPSWLLDKPPVGTSEDEAVDNALLPEHRGTIATARAKLLATLEAAAVTLPGDDWITGQRVRFLLDQKQVTEAMRVARQCSASAWWCTALYGYAMHAGRNWASADSAFAIALPKLPEEIRCEWNDLYAIIPAADREKYDAVFCADRDTLTANYWWLADPLYSTPGNERRVEHYARNVRVLLSSALDEDERYNWTPEHGSEALKEMILRYGTPSSAVWIGAREDSLHEKHLAERAALSAPPYLTAEYSSRRGHFAPVLSALPRPLSANADNWQAGPPTGMRTTVEGRGNYWWPEEHMNIGNAAVVQYDAGQVAFFSRRDDVEVAVAIDIGEAQSNALASLAGGSVRSVLVASPTPTVFQRVAESSAPVSNRLSLTGHMRAYPSLLSVETPATAPGGVMARTRFGVVPPKTLSELPAGQFSASDPAFFSVAPGVNLPANLEQLLPLMRGSTTVPLNSKLGVFWETYGLTVGDSVEIMFNITAAAAPNQNRPLIRSAFRLGSAAPGVLTARWPDMQHAAQPASVEGAPILARSVVLDLTSIPPGDYVVSLIMVSGARAPVRTARALAIR